LYDPAMDATSVAQAGVLSLSFLHEMKVMPMIENNTSGRKDSFFMIVFLNSDWFGFNLCT